MSVICRNLYNEEAEELDEEGYGVRAHEDAVPTDIRSGRRILK